MRMLVQVVVLVIVVAVVLMVMHAVCAFLVPGMCLLVSRTSRYMTLALEDGAYMAAFPWGF